MASNFTRRPSALGVPLLYETVEGTNTDDYPHPVTHPPTTILLTHAHGSNTVAYPHLVTQFAVGMFQRTWIDVRIGPPEASLDHPTQGNFVQHPEPFDADDTLNTACRTLLLTCVQDAIRRSKINTPSRPLRKCVVWSPTSCSYVETDGSIFETAFGLAAPVRIAFEAARLILNRDIYPQINVATPYGITREACPVDVSKGEAVAQAVEIVLRTGWRARVVCSESETICAELIDQIGAQCSRIKACAVWSEHEPIDADPASWHAKLDLKYPHIVAGGKKECVFFYPDTLTKKELTAKAAEILARGYPRVRIIWSSEEDQERNATKLVEKLTDPKVDEKNQLALRQAADRKQLSHFVREINSGKAFEELDAATRAWWWNRY